MRAGHGTAILLLALLLMASAPASCYDYVGNWEWVSTMYNHVGISFTETPASTGHTRQCRFGPPAEGSIYREYQDKLLVGAGTWTEVLDEWGVGTILSITANGYKRHIEYSDIWQGTLRLDDGWGFERWTRRTYVDTVDQTWGAIKSLYR